MSTALIILADGAEEMEAIAPIDLLRRAGVEVTVAGVPNVDITGKSGLRMTADVPLDAVAQQIHDLVVIPGGPAFKTLRKNARVRSLLQSHASAGKLLGAICAAPTVLADAGLLEGRAYTAHFSVADELGSLDESRAVVEDGAIITSRGAGTATEFALALVQRLKGEAAADEVARSICYDR